MGCFAARSGLSEIPSAKGIFLLKDEPTLGNHTQSVSIDISSRTTHSMLEQSQNPESEIIVKHGRIAILLNSANQELDEYNLSQKIEKMLIRTNKALKSTLIIQTPNYSIDNPATTLQINRQLFKAIITALIDFSTKVEPSRSLKYVYFKWQPSEVQQLFHRNQAYFRAMQSILIL